MKGTYKTIFKSSLFIAILVFILMLLSYLFIPKSNNPGFGMVNVEANGILGEKENTIDVLFLGDSEAYSSFSPMEIYGNNGFTSYVCATGGQRLYYTYDFFKKALKDQKPKVVVLETNTIYSEIKSIDLLTNKINNLFPIFLYHNRWKHFNINNLTYKLNYTYSDDFKGFVYNTKISGTSENDYMKPNNYIQEIPYLNKIYVEKMIKFCKENNIKFVLVSTPSTVNWNYSKHLAIEKFANEKEIEYVDLNQIQMDDTIDWQKDTKDGGDHLNYSGALKVSKYIGNYLKKNYGLENHKDDTNYTHWNEALIRYNKEVVK